MRSFQVVTKAVLPTWKLFCFLTEKWAIFLKNTE